jgi:predicted ATP-grasp superfamily ATP-dependent carboligase
MLDRRYKGFSGLGCRAVRVNSADDEAALLRHWSALSDWTLVIAPEFGDLLLRRCQAVEEAAGRLLGPSSEIVAIAADKQQTANQLRDAGVPVAIGIPLEDSDAALLEFQYPAVIKHRFGAGSLDVFLTHDREAARRIRAEVRGPLRMERYYPGVAASVAVLTGAGSCVPLPPCRQDLSSDGRFTYLGGACPLAPGLAEQATELALRAVAAISQVEPPRGYLGIDMVLGATSGHENVVIEINPRLTTSYVGLRRIAEGNLAAAMLAVAEGRPPQLSWSNRRVEFDADGTVRA